MSETPGFIGRCLAIQQRGLSERLTNELIESGGEALVSALETMTNEALLRINVADNRRTEAKK